MSTFKRKLIPVFQRRRASNLFADDVDAAKFAPIDIAELVNEKIIFEAGEYRVEIRLSLAHKRS